MSTTKHRLISVTGVALALSLTACNGTSSSGLSKTTTLNGRNESSGGALTGNPVGGGAGANAAMPSSPHADVIRLVLDSRKLIRTATLTVAVKDVAAAVRAAEQAVERSGGAVYAEQVQHDKKSAVAAQLTLKVTPSTYGSVLDALASSLGTEIARSQTVKDVTEDVVDVAARLDVQRRAIARVKALLDHATRLGDIISLESDLSTREAAFESLQARQRALAAQTDLATIELTLQRNDTSIVAAALKPKHKTERGFIAGLKSGWAAFQTSAQGLFTAVGAVLPFAVLAAVAAVGILGWRRRRLGLAPAHVVD